MLKHIILITNREIEPLENLEKECREHQVRLYYGLPGEDTLIAETLYITDHGEIAQALWEEKANVLAWLHEHNREQNFSKLPHAIEGIEEIDFTYLNRIYQRFQKEPWIIGQTERCIIREMAEEDLDDIYEIYSGESITKYMEGLYEDREEELEYLRCYIENEYTFWGYGTWMIERKEDGKLIGRVGFNMREGYDEPELGFVIGEPYQKQGYAYECCKAALEVGKKEYEFTVVQALVKPGNAASIRLCNKLGFESEKMVEVEEEQYIRFCLKL